MLVPVENIKYVQNVSKVLDIFLFRLDIPWTHFLLRRLRCECPKCVQTFGQIMGALERCEYGHILDKKCPNCAQTVSEHEVNVQNMTKKCLEFGHLSNI